MFYLLIKRRYGERKSERERDCSMACEQIKSLAEFQSFPISFQSSTTDLEMLINHLLIADSRLGPFLHFWWMHFKNRPSFGKKKHLFGFTLVLCHFNKECKDVLVQISAGSHTKRCGVTLTMFFFVVFLVTNAED